MYIFFDLICFHIYHITEILHKLHLSFVIMRATLLCLSNTFNSFVVYLKFRVFIELDTFTHVINIYYHVSNSRICERNNTIILTNKTTFFIIKQHK